MKSKVKKELSAVNCKNCNTSFKGNFCPHCGQSIYEYDRPFRFLVADFTGNLFAFDTRFWRSFKALLLRPGKFAKDFISGKRARYMAPFRFYIFSSFIFFILFSKYLAQEVTISNENRELVTKALQPQDSLDTYKEYLKDEILENLEDEMRLSDEQKESILLAVESLDSVVQDDSANLQTQILEKLEDEIPLSNEEKESILLAVESLDSVVQDDFNDLQIQVNGDEISQKELKQLKDAIMDNPQIYINSFLKFFSWSLFILMPVYAFILWCFHFRRIRYYFGHLIMAINQHNFWFILLSFVLLLHFIFPTGTGNSTLYFLWLLPAHTLWGYRQLYRRSWFKTIFYAFATWFLYALILILSVGVCLVFWIQTEFGIGIS